MSSQSESSNAVLLLLSALALNATLSLDRILDRTGYLATISPSSPIVLGFCFLLVLLTVGCYLTAFRYWLYTVVILIPLEVSVPVAFFPKLSPIDYFAAASALALVLRIKPKELVQSAYQAFPRTSFIFLSAFLIYALVASVALHGVPRPTFRWGEFLYFYFVAALAAKEAPSIATQKVLSNLLSATGALVSIVAICQFAGSGGHAAEAHATFGHRNVMAAFLSLSLPAASVVIAQVESPWTPMRKVASFFMLCAFIMSYSRGAWVGLAVAVLFVLSRWREGSVVGKSHIKNALLIVIMLIGPLGFLLILRNPERGIFSSSQRPLYWEAAWNVVRARPLTGLGPGNYDRDLPTYLSEKGLLVFNTDLSSKHRIDFWQHLHNLYLQIAVENGLIGFAFWAIGLFSLVAIAFRRALADPQSLKPYFMMSVVAFLVHNTVDLMTVSSLDLLVAFFLAISINGDRTVSTS